MNEKQETVNHPQHYVGHPSGIECIEVVEHMNFCIGNAIKYLWRADLKGKAIEDLEKARWYIDREIQRRNKKKPMSDSDNIRKIKSTVYGFVPEDNGSTILVASSEADVTVLKRDFESEWNTFNSPAWYEIEPGLVDVSEDWVEDLLNDWKQKNDIIENKKIEEK
jgi:hypothetical protein